MYGRIGAILHHCGCPDALKYKVWAECANISTDLWNIQVQQDQVISPHELFFGSLPKYSRHLHVFGQMGIVLDGSASTLKDKLKNKGVKKMFVGYSRLHSHDVCRMYNLDTGRVSVTRDIRWLDQLIGDDSSQTTATLFTDTDETDSFLGGDPTDESNVDKTSPALNVVNKSTDAKEYAGKSVRFDIGKDYDKGRNDDSKDGDDDHDNDDNDDGSSTHGITDEDDDKHGHTSNPRVRRELRRLHTFYNPTTDDMGEIALVGGTDESYSNPPTFTDAWNQPKGHDRMKWREGIRKEFKDMIGKGVWRKMKIRNRPKDRRPIGCRWVNKVKRNGVFRARLVALGYSQIPGLDNTENYVPVIQDVTFRLICIIMLAHGW